MLLTLLVAATQWVRADFFCQKQDFAAADWLLQSHISNVKQDNKGFIWFATWNGLMRFDGYNLYTFKPVQCSDGTIYSNRIYNVKLTQEGYLWCVSSDNRLFLFDPDKCRFTDLHLNIPAIKDKKVKSVTPHKRGFTWVVFRDNSCLRINNSDPLDDYTFYETGSASLLGSRQINATVCDSGGNEWILTDRGAVNYKDGRHIEGNFISMALINGLTYFLTVDGDITDINGHRRTVLSPERLKINYSIINGNRIIVATDRGVWGIDPLTGTTINYHSAPSIYLFSDSQRRVWAFGSDNNVVLISDTSRPQSLALSATPSPNGGQPVRNPQLIFQDKSGRIILKPQTGVLSYYDETTRTLKDCIFYKDNVTYTYSPEVIKKFIVDHDDNLWVFGENSSECINFSPVFFNHYENRAKEETRAIVSSTSGIIAADRSNSLAITDKDGNPAGYIARDGSITSVPTPFSSKPVYCFERDSRGRLWAGTKGDGLYLLTPRGNSDKDGFTVRHYRNERNDPTSLVSDTVYDIAFEGNRAWLASYGSGLFSTVADADSLRFTRVKGQPAGMKLREIVPAGNGVMLLGTADGLVTADMRNPASPRFTVNRFSPAPNRLKGNDIMRILKVGDRYYLCVYGSGVSRIDSPSLLADSLDFTTFPTSQEGMTDRIKTAIASGNDIWIVADRSVTRFSTATGTYTTFGPENFIGNFSFSEAQPLVGGGNIVLGTSDGILAFNPSVFTSVNNSGRLAVTGLKYQNDPELHPLNDPDSISFTPDRRSFSLYFSSMDFGGGESADMYRYRLDNYDKGWNYVGENQPAVHYNNLPPGEYTLIIQSLDRNGVWGTVERDIHLTVEPRFTETAWFRLLIAFIIAAAILGLVYGVIYFKRMRNAIQKKYSLLMTVERTAVEPESPAASDEPDSDERDRLFIEQSVKFLNDNIDNTSLVVEDFARNLGMSRTAYYNRMKQITGLSPVDFIKQMRIKMALRLLDKGDMTIADVAYRVGFKDPKYFSRCFKAEMDMTPTQYLESKNS